MLPLGDIAGFLHELPALADHAQAVLKGPCARSRHGSEFAERRRPAVASNCRFGGTCSFSS